MSKSTTIARKTKKKAPGNGHRLDGAQDVARASLGLTYELNTDQVRILRALKGSRKPMDRASLKEAVGNGHKKGYNVRWIHNYRRLVAASLIAESEREPQAPLERRKHVFSILPEGRAALDAAEKALVKIKESRSAL